MVHEMAEPDTGHRSRGPGPLRPSGCARAGSTMVNEATRHGAREEAEMATMERIVVGGDHTPSATAALRWAVREAGRTGAGVCVVHAFDLEGRADLALERDLDRARRDARYRTQAWVVEVLRDLDTSVPVVVSTPDGTVEHALAEASRGAQMLVIGEPQRGRRHALGTDLRRLCHCPVVTVAAEPEPAGV